MFVCTLYSNPTKYGVVNINNKFVESNENHANSIELIVNSKHVKFSRLTNFFVESSGRFHRMNNAVR